MNVTVVAYCHKLVMENGKNKVVEENYNHDKREKKFFSFLKFLMKI